MSEFVDHETQREAQRENELNAPSVADCLTRAHVPKHYHRAAERAFRDWLHSWNGLGETAESLAKDLRY